MNNKLTYIFIIFMMLGLELRAEENAASSEEDNPQVQYQIEKKKALSGIIETQKNMIELNKEKLLIKDQQIENYLVKIKKQEKYISLLLKKIELLEKENKSLAEQARKSK